MVRGQRLYEYTELSTPMLPSFGSVFGFSDGVNGRPCQARGRPRGKPALGDPGHLSGAMINQSLSTTSAHKSSERDNFFTRHLISEHVKTGMSAKALTN